MKKHLILQWTARIAGLLVTLFFGSFLLGEGIPDIMGGEGKALIPFLLLLSIPFFGYFVAWHKPLSGGWIIIIGASLLAGYFWYFGNWAMMAMYGVPALLIGLCFLASRDQALI